MRTDVHVINLTIGNNLLYECFILQDTMTSMSASQKLTLGSIRFYLNQLFRKGKNVKADSYAKGQRTVDVMYLRILCQG